MVRLATKMSGLRPFVVRKILLFFYEDYRATPLFFYETLLFFYDDYWAMPYDDFRATPLCS